MSKLSNVIKSMTYNYNGLNVSEQKQKAYYERMVYNKLAEKDIATRSGRDKDTIERLENEIYFYNAGFDYYVNKEQKYKMG